MNTPNTRALVDLAERVARLNPTPDEDGDVHVGAGMMATLVQLAQEALGSAQKASPDQNQDDFDYRVKGYVQRATQEISVARMLIDLNYHHTPSCVTRAAIALHRHGCARVRVKGPEHSGISTHYIPPQMQNVDTEV